MGLSDESGGVGLTFTEGREGREHGGCAAGLRGADRLRGPGWLILVTKLERRSFASFERPSYHLLTKTSRETSMSRLYATL